MNYDLVVLDKTVSVGVVAEEADLGSPEVVTKINFENIKKMASNVETIDTIEVNIDDRRWLKTSLTCEKNNYTLKYIFWVYSGKEGTFEVVFWGIPNIIDKNSDSISEVARSFRLPKP